MLRNVQTQFVVLVCSVWTEGCSSCCAREITWFTTYLCKICQCECTQVTYIMSATASLQCSQRHVIFSSVCLWLLRVSHPDAELSNCSLWRSVKLSLIYIHSSFSVQLKFPPTDCRLVQKDNVLPAIAQTAAAYTFINIELKRSSLFVTGLKTSII